MVDSSSHLVSMAIGETKSVGEPGFKVKKMFQVSSASAVGLENG
ncbi:MAG: hypothetical protein V7731_20300 [Amphritea sp.]